VTRRAFVACSLGLLAWTISGSAQPATKVPRVGILSPASSSNTPAFEAFRRGLRDLGYEEGRTITIEYGLARGNLERLPMLAGELVRLGVDIIVTDGGSSASAAASSVVPATIPVVMATSGDPVAAGLVTSFARPGGHITGLSLQSPTLESKRLDVLKALAPRATRMAVVLQPSSLPKTTLADLENAARVLHVELRRFDADTPADIDLAFRRLSTATVEGILCIPSAMLWNERTRVVELAGRTRLPAVYPEREYVDVGGLMSYGPNVPANFYRAATYVDKILKGARPGDLPIEEPSKFELIVNLKAARTFGLAIPSSLLARADQVIE